MLTPQLHILPPAQRALWPRLAGLPAGFVLYGGTAVALRCGHRQSVDFDFFSHLPLDAEGLLAQAPWLAGAQVISWAKDAAAFLVPGPDGPVKLSFLGGLGCGRVGVPDRSDDGAVVVASALDPVCATLCRLAALPTP